MAHVVNKYESNNDLTAQLPIPQNKPISSFFDNILDVAEEEQSSSDSSDDSSQGMEMDNSPNDYRPEEHEMEP